tara:strand:+ start:459 stop:1961 length:1503 start_codon:yes stop_codon:yes gene_type:complete
MSTSVIATGSFMRNATHYAGQLVSFDTGLGHEKDYNFYYSQGTPLVPKDTFSNGIACSNSGKIATVGMVTTQTSSWPYSSFVQCLSRNASSKALTLDWVKVYNLYLHNTDENLSSFNPQFRHVVMDNTYIYAATQYHLSGYYTGSNPNFWGFNGKTKAAVMKLRISDGNLMWVRMITIGDSSSDVTKGITSLGLTNNVLYAAFSHKETGAGYDYVKINTADGDFVGSNNLITSVPMENQIETEASALGKYSFINFAGSGTTWSFNSIGLDTSVTVSETLDATDLQTTPSRQWGLNPTNERYTSKLADTRTSNPTSISTTSFTMNGLAAADQPGEHPITVKGFVYSTTSTSPVIGGSGVTNITKGGGTGSFSHNLSGLSQGTAYYHRAYTTYARHYSGRFPNPYYTGTVYGDVKTATTTQIQINPFLASANSNFGGVCFASSNTNTYYWAGTGSSPATGDTCYTSSSGGTNYLPSGYYKLNSSNSFIIVTISGVIDDVLSC